MKKWVQLGASSVYVFAATLLWFSVPPLATTLSHDLNLSFSEVGLLLSSPGLGALLFGPIGGLLPDFLGTRKTMGVSALVLVVSGLLRGLVPNYFGILVGTFGIGIADTIALTNSVKIIDLWFPKNQTGVANGIWNIGVNLGALIALAISADLMFLTGGWERVYLLYGVVALAIFPLWWLLAKAQVSGTARHEFAKVSMGAFDLLRSRDMKLLFVAFFCLGGAQIGIVAWLPTILESRGIETSQANALTSLVWVGAIVGNLIVPALSDRIAHRKLLSFVFFLLLSTIIYLASFGPEYALWVLVFGIGFFSSPIYSLLFSIALGLRVGLSELTGRMAALQFVMVFLGSAVEPLLAGIMRDVSGTFYAVVVLYCLTAVLGGSASMAIRE